MQGNQKNSTVRDYIRFGKVNYLHSLFDLGLTFNLFPLSTTESYHFQLHQVKKAVRNSYFN